MNNVSLINKNIVKIVTSYSVKVVTINRLHKIMMNNNSWVECREYNSTQTSRFNLNSWIVNEYSQLVQTKNPHNIIDIFQGHGTNQPTRLNNVVQLWYHVIMRVLLLVVFFWERELPQWIMIREKRPWHRKAHIGYLGVEWPQMQAWNIESSLDGSTVWRPSQGWVGPTCFGPTITSLARPITEGAGGRNKKKNTPHQSLLFGPRVTFNEAITYVEEFVVGHVHLTAHYGYIMLTRMTSIYSRWTESGFTWQWLVIDYPCTNYDHCIS